MISFPYRNGESADKPVRAWARKGVEIAKMKN
jgi:hypothetical protein